MTIRVGTTGAGTYEVTVEGASTTVHSVTVTPEYLQKLTGGRASAEMLIEKSFEFLRASRALAHEHRYQHARGHQDRGEHVPYSRLLA